MTGAGTSGQRHSQVFSFPVSRPTLEPPQLPDLTLTRLIGRGSYGEVWIGRTVTGAARAVKIVRRNSFSDSRPFEREFEGVKRSEAVSREHPGLADVLHVGQSGSGDFFYYVMELADSAAALACGTTADLNDAYQPRTLRQDLKKFRRLTIADCLRVATPIVEAVAFLHERELLHRDIKTSNVIFVGGQSKLADIGLVTSRDRARSLVGTEGYLPPEGPGTKEADVYALGKLLYEISTGQDPLDFPELPAGFREFDDREAFLNLNEVISRACDLNPRRRPLAAALAAELNLLRSGKRLLRPKAKRAAGRLALAIACIGALVGILVWANGTGHELNRGLVAYFHLDGNTREENGRSNDAVTFGIEPAEDRFGRPKRACRFDGESSRVQIKDGLFDPETKGFTFSAWVAPDPPSASGPQMIINKGAERGEATLQLSKGRYRFGPKLRDSSYVFADAPAIPGCWTHLVGVYERGCRVELWVNGDLASAATPPNEPLHRAPGYYSSIGIYSHAMGVWGCFKGVLDEVRIWDRPLSSAEVRALHESEANQSTRR